MTVWEHGELLGSNLTNADLSGARMPMGRIHGCGLSNVELAGSDLVGSHLQRSNLEGIRAGDALRGATIRSDQLIPATFALFRAVRVSVDDDAPPSRPPSCQTEMPLDPLQALAELGNLGVERSCLLELAASARRCQHLVDHDG